MLWAASGSSKTTYIISSNASFTAAITSIKQQNPKSMSTIGQSTDAITSLSCGKKWSKIVSKLCLRSQCLLFQWSSLKKQKLQKKQFQRHNARQICKSHSIMSNDLRSSLSRIRGTNTITRSSMSPIHIRSSLTSTKSSLNTDLPYQDTDLRQSSNVSSSFSMETTFSLTSINTSTTTTHLAKEHTL